MEIKKIIVLLLIVLMVSSLPLFIKNVYAANNDIALYGNTNYIGPIECTGKKGTVIYNKTFSNLNKVQLTVQLWVQGSTGIKVYIYDTDNGEEIYNGIAKGGGKCNTIDIHCSDNEVLRNANRVTIQLSLTSIVLTNKMVEGSVLY